MPLIVEFVAAYSMAVAVEAVASIAVDMKSIAEAGGLTCREGQRVAAYSFAEEDNAVAAAEA